MKKTIFWAGLLVLTLGSCSKVTDADEKLLEEEQALDAWIADNQPNAEKLAPGLYVVVSEAKGLKPEAGQHVLVNFNQRFLADGTLEITSYADSNERPLFPSNYLYGGPEIWQIAAAPLHGYTAGVSKMAEGQTANIYLSSRYNEITGEVDYKSRRLEVELVKVIPELSVYQDSLSYDFASAIGSKVDTIVRISNIDDRARNIMSAVADSGKGASLKGRSKINAKIKAYYALQRGIKVQYYGNPETIDLKSFPYFNSYTTERYVDQLVAGLKVGGRLSVVMPYIIYLGNETIQTQDFRVEVPKKSIIIFDISIVE